MKKDFIHVDNPEFEVHNFFSLSEVTGYHATNLQQMYGKQRITFIATNFYKSKNMFAITKQEINRIRALRAVMKNPLGKFGRSNGDPDNND